MLPWVVARLQTRLPEMLRAAGGAHVADQVDMRATAPVIDTVEQMAQRARAEHPAGRDI